MPRNFDKVLKIDSKGCLSPRGPLGRVKGETISRLEVWIFQKRSDGTNVACMASQDSFPDDKVWTTKPEHFRDGQFRPGPATAMALMVSKKGGKTTVFQWNDDVQLE